MTEQDPGLLRRETGLYKVKLEGKMGERPLPSSQLRFPAAAVTAHSHIVMLGGPRHSPVGLAAPSPLSPPSLLGSPEGHLLPSVLQAQPFLGGLGDQEGPHLLVCLEVPREKINNTY